MGTLLENCKARFKSCPIGKLQTDSVAYFYKLRDPNRCNIFGFKHSIASNDGGVLYSYNYEDKPDEKVCGLDKCDMTGTLFVTPSSAEEAKPPVVVTEIKANAENFQFGYLRVFVYGSKNDNFKLSVSTMLSSTDSNDYDVTLAQDGWNAVMIELFNPDNVTGVGWVADNGSIKLTITPNGMNSFRLSTAELFSDIYDLVKDQTIGFTCVTDFSGDPSLTLTEDLCDIAQYDETATTIERSLTASNIVGELADFHNITRRQNSTEHLVQTRDEFTAVLETVNDIEYATFNIPELADIQCPRLLVQPQNCEFNTLYHVDIDNDQSFIILPEEQFFRKNNKIFMNSSFAGAKIVVAYPIWVEGTAWDITAADLNKQHYQMEMVTPICGDEYVIKADNVMLTSLPLTWTSGAGTFTVGYTMAKDSYGKYGSIIKLDQRK
ncbi:hypothetical protein [Enterococcus gallinarum]|uniref:hypothetical protein n=1 Tax=Enterococcus gallinarum TaxID=1353 RepID=UPI00288D3BC2|nr:hypothetical protein [Enterococcus gallinarum]MDT2685807.1 hypothetical protein [Enterococcus gallinarum]